VYAILSLRLVCILPVGISMIGTHLSAASVLLSIFAHGLSASPGVRRYARQIDRLGADAPERDGQA
jgi:hypothetical protein